MATQITRGAGDLGIAIAVGLVVGLIFAGMAGAFAPVEPVNQPNTFDHSDCQYPYRTTNPVDGCDNSDPCDPQSAAKGGSGECTDTPKAVEPVATTPANIEQKSYSCEGK